MKKRPSIIILTLLLSLTIQNVQASRTSGGTTLIESAGARSSSLGEAFTAGQNDITALHFNPASLASLENSQASFFYRKGLVEDSFGRFMVGHPQKNQAFGASIGYYNGGDVEIVDGEATQNLQGQRDLTLAVGYARRFQSLQTGLSGKYLSAQLIEGIEAKTWALDFGVSMNPFSRLRVGGAIQNIGPALKFSDQGDPLPRMARLGASYDLFKNNYTTTLWADGVYMTNESEFRPALGLEFLLGPLALRGGFRLLNDSNEISAGAGFIIGSLTLNYAMAMIQEFDTQHKVSLSMHFGENAKSKINYPSRESSNNTEPLDSSTSSSLIPLTIASPSGGAQRKTVVYEIKPGDTLKIISEKFYGHKNNAVNILRANQHLNPDQNLIVGQKIIIPQ